MQEGGRNLTAHSLPETESPDRLQEQVVQPEQRRKQRHLAVVVVFANRIDVPEQPERINWRQIEDQVASLSEYGPDFPGVLYALLVRIAAEHGHAPAVGRMIPARILMVVDLPAPFGPSSPTISPGKTSKLKSSRA